MPETQITADERYALGLLRKQGYRPAEMARALSRHPSTISRELRRNVWRCNGRGYVPSRAQSYTNERRRRSRRNSQFSPAEWALVESVLREDYSPAQVVGWCARFEILTISHETISRHIWQDKKAGGTLPVHLRRANTRFRKRYGANDSRGRLAGTRHISTRPAGAANRSRIGQWEVDTVLGDRQGGACIVTLVERKTGYVVIGKLARGATADLNARLEVLVRRQPHAVRTITADNDLHPLSSVASRSWGMRIRDGDAAAPSVHHRRGRTRTITCARTRRPQWTSTTHESPAHHSGTTQHPDAPVASRADRSSHSMRAQWKVRALSTRSLPPRRPV